MRPPTCLPRTLAHNGGFAMSRNKDGTLTDEDLMRRLESHLDYEHLGLAALPAQVMRSG